jgi:uncharacterized membrane-anchored protein YhcB (DUF1043 family)
VESFVAYAALLAAGLIVGWGVGLWRNQLDAQRARDLAAQLERTAKERELARQELDVARDSLRRLTQDYDAYRGRVADHFAGSSERLRDLAIQYRAVYQHLAEGASALCPETFRGLEGRLEALTPLDEPQAAPEAEPEPAAERAAS